MTPSRVSAVLGPTNTGKTHHAIERMLAHRTGVIGLPLRLLAREVYDRIVRLRGPSVVALVTGEERIVPDRAAYWVCTVEAMPDGMGADFLAVDEIQLCADPERGHVFTDRLLHARGLHETLFLGSDTMRGAIAALVPGVTFQHKERFSTLSYTGPKKISRMPERSAIVGFSVENVYAIAEFIRRTRGGAAVVMGALSPRTRNAQVELYQNGDVDFLVATDAIGMGLNLDIGHVAFSSLPKFQAPSASRARRPRSTRTSWTPSRPTASPPCAACTGATPASSSAPSSGSSRPWRSAPTTPGSPACASPTTSPPSRRWPRTRRSRRGRPTGRASSCSGTSAASPTSGASRGPSTRPCWASSSTTSTSAARCPPSSWPSRSSASPAPTATSTRCPSGWPSSGPGPTWPSARGGWATKRIGARRRAR